MNSPFTCAPMMDSLLSNDFVSQPSGHQRRLSLSSTPPLKLRDSCDACAASKVKCHKEKPVCSRCAKRGVVCKYVVTKRAGRKHESRQSGPSNIGIAPPQVAVGQAVGITNWPITPSTTTGPDYLPSASTINDSLGLDMSSSMDLKDLVSPVDPGMYTIPDLNTDFDSFFASPLSLSLPDTIENVDLDVEGESAFFSGGTNRANSIATATTGTRNDSLTMLEDAVQVSPFFSQTSPQSQRPTSAANSTTSVPQDLAAHSCLLRALELLRRLFPTPPEACQIAKCNSLESKDQDPTIEAVIAENEKTITTLNDMLDCPCSEDGYLLAIISLVVFKVMAWYAAAAGRKGMQEDDGEVSVTGRSSRSLSVHREQVVQQPEVVGNYLLSGKDSDRMVAQLVLSELHRVQRLVNALTEKMKAKAAGEGLVTPDSAAGGQIARAFSNGALPFSPGMLDQLGTDLRRRLRGLSLDIMETLRRDS